MSIGLLILRVVLGLLFVGHGTQKLFGWFDGHGPKGTGRWFEGLGYRPGPRHAVTAGLAEAAGGVSLVLGFLTPLGCAAIVGVMINAIGSVHAPNGPWVTNNGYEYPLVAASAAACIAFTGPGAASVDHLFGVGFNGIGWALLAVTIGIVAGVMQLNARETEPVASDERDVEPRKPAREHAEASR